MKEVFQKNLDAELQVLFEPALEMAAQIEELKDLDDKGLAFSVLLSTHQKESYYSQGTYEVKFPSGEVVFVFMVPIGPKGDKMLYEAVFN